MKKVAVIMLLVLVGMVTTTWAQVLNVPQKNQEQTQWCWAACSQAILAYHGRNYSQSTIAQYGTNGANIWNWLWGQTSNPVRRGIDMILSHFGSIGTRRYSRALSQSECQAEIMAGDPFTIRWGWSSGGGHFVVARGIERSTMYIMDPWYGPTVSSYNWVVSGSSHTWTHTLTE